MDLVLENNGQIANNKDNNNRSEHRLFSGYVGRGFDGQAIQLLVVDIVDMLNVLHHRMVAEIIQLSNAK